MAFICGIDSFICGIDDIDLIDKVDIGLLNWVNVGNLISTMFDNGLDLLMNRKKVCKKI